MTERIVREDTGRVIGVAAFLWSVAIGAAAAEGAFARFDAPGLAIFAGLAALYAAAIYRFDASLRGHAAGYPRGVVNAAALVSFVALAAALALRWSAAAVYLAPLASLAGAAAWDGRRRATRGARRASSAKSPGARPAAT